MADGSVFDLIRRRRSIPKFTGEPVPRTVIERMLEAATWAPNHHHTEPWQFFVLEDAAKTQFAELRRAFRLSLFPDTASPAAQAADKIARDTAATPVIIAATTRVSSDPSVAEDDYAATMIAVQNMLLTALEDGVGTYVRTGGFIHDPQLRAFLDLPADRRVAAIIYAGYPAVIPERRRAPWEDKTVWLTDRRPIRQPAPAPAPAPAESIAPAASERAESAAATVPGPGRSADGHSAAPREGFAIDPVCKMEVEIATAPATSVYNGKTYYFCAPGCKTTFDEHPDIYA